MEDPENPIRLIDNMRTSSPSLVHKEDAPEDGDVTVETSNGENLPAVASLETEEGLQFCVRELKVQSRLDEDGIQEVGSISETREEDDLAMREARTELLRDVVDYVISWNRDTESDDSSITCNALWNLALTGKCSVISHNYQLIHEDDDNRVSHLISPQNSITEELNPSPVSENNMESLESRPNKKQRQQ